MVLSENHGIPAPRILGGKIPTRVVRLKERLQLD